MCNHLSDISQAVKMKSVVSSFLPCNTGVVQGSVIAPKSFNLVTRHLVIDEEKSLLLKFSDDQVLTVVLRSPTDWLMYNDSVEKLSQWYKSNNLILNPSKTQELVFINKGLSNSALLNIASEQLRVNGVSMCQRRTSDSSSRKSIR